MDVREIAENSLFKPFDLSVLFFILLEDTFFRTFIFIIGPFLFGLHFHFLSPGTENVTAQRKRGKSWDILSFSLPPRFWFGSRFIVEGRKDAGKGLPMADLLSANAGRVIEKIGDDLLRPARGGYIIALPKTWDESSWRIYLFSFLFHH